FRRTVRATRDDPSATSDEVRHPLARDFEEGSGQGVESHDWRECWSRAAVWRHRAPSPRSIARQIPNGLFVSQPAALVTARGASVSVMLSEARGSHDQL